MNRHNLYYFLLLSHLLIAINQIDAQTANHSLYYERVYLQTDRDIYVAGETLFFKLYMVNGLTSAPTVKSRFAYLVLRNPQSTVIAGIHLEIENSMSYGSIYLPDTLKTGSYQLVSYTNCMRNFGEEHFFTREILIINRFDKDLNKISDQPVTNATNNALKPETRKELKEKQNTPTLILTPERYKFPKREKVRIALETIGVPEESTANLSISVSEVASHFDNSPSINDYLADNTIGFNANKASNCTYFPETDGTILQGRVINSENRHFMANTVIFLSAPDSIANLQFTKTDTIGSFRFLLNDYYNKKEIILRLPYDQKANIELDNKFDIKKPFAPSRSYNDSVIKGYLPKCQNIVQIQKTYHIEPKEVLTVTRITESQASQASQVYPPNFTPIYPADFVKLPDFIEISREILPLLKVRKHGDQYVAKMLIENQRDYSSVSQPLIFLDGVPIDDINQIISLGSEKISRIETVGSQRYFGGLNFFGILSVFSKTLEINNIGWKTPVLLVNMFANQSFSEPLKPDYSKSDKNFKYKPDLRQLLYWEPNFTLNGKEKKYIEFYTSDNSGEFEVKVEGISNTGAPINAKAFIKISSDKK